MDSCETVTVEVDPRILEAAREAFARDGVTVEEACAAFVWMTAAYAEEYGSLPSFVDTIHADRDAFFAGDANRMDRLARSDADLAAGRTRRFADAGELRARASECFGS